MSHTRCATIHQLPGSVLSALVNIIKLSNQVCKGCIYPLSLSSPLLEIGPSPVLSTSFSHRYVNITHNEIPLNHTAGDKFTVLWIHRGARQHRDKTAIVPVQQFWFVVLGLDEAQNTRFGRDGVVEHVFAEESVAKAADVGEDFEVRLE